jgi:hypothetical protein
VIKYIHVVVGQPHGNVTDITYNLLHSDYRKTLTYFSEFELGAFEANLKTLSRATKLERQRRDYEPFENLEKLGDDE